MGMGKRQKRQRNWLYDPPADETPRERQYRLGMLGLLDWMAGKILEQLLAESEGNHDAQPESEAPVLEEVPGGGRRGRRRRQVDTKLGQRDTAQSGVIDLGDVGNGVGTAHR